jgi:hypothetical protein
MVPAPPCWPVSQHTRPPCESLFQTDPTAHRLPHASARLKPHPTSRSYLG